MKEISHIINEKEKEYATIEMKIDMKVNGRQIKLMGKANLFDQGIIMKEISKMELKKERIICIKNGNLEWKNNIREEKGFII